MDRPKRAEGGEKVAVESVVYSTWVVLRFGCTGGGRSVVVREGDEGECVRGRDSERGRNGEGERRSGLREARPAPATCSNERVDATDAVGLTRGRGGSTGVVGPAPSMEEERGFPPPIPGRFGGLPLCVELFRTCRTRFCSRCVSIRFAS